MPPSAVGYLKNNCIYKPMTYISCCRSHVLLCEHSSDVYNFASHRKLLYHIQVFSKGYKLKDDFLSMSFFFKNEIIIRGGSSGGSGRALVPYRRQSHGAPSSLPYIFFHRCTARRGWNCLDVEESLLTIMLDPPLLEADTLINNVVKSLDHVYRLELSWKYVCSKT